MMTLFSYANKALAEIKSTMNACALMVFLLLFLTSTLAHANHLTEQSLNTEQQECYLCHQGVDIPPELLKVQVHCAISYYFSPEKAATVAFKVSHFVQPQLRAPPSFP